jgi:hypothetical protein
MRTNRLIQFSRTEAVRGVLILDPVTVARLVQPAYLSLIGLLNHHIPKAENDECHRPENEIREPEDIYRAERVPETQRDAAGTCPGHLKI